MTGQRDPVPLQARLSGKVQRLMKNIRWPGMGNQMKSNDVKNRKKRVVALR
jgi:hypothetical protein